MEIAEVSIEKISLNHVQEHLIKPEEFHEVGKSLIKNLSKHGFIHLIDHGISLVSYTKKYRQIISNAN